MALQNQVNFALLSEAQRIELCKRYGVSPNDTNAEVKINSIITEAAKNNGQDRLAGLKAEYQASNDALAAAKADKLKSYGIFTARQNEYSSDPTNFNLVDSRTRYELANNQYNRIDRCNDNLNSALFDEILSNGKMLA